MPEARKTTMEHITMDHLSQSKIVLPPVELVDKFEEEIKRIYKEIYDYQDEKNLLKKLCISSLDYLL